MLDQITAERSKRIARCSPVCFSNVSLTIDGKPVIRNINCKLDGVGKTVILGSNGAGKSLFLRLMAGLMMPSEGDITCEGERLQDKRGLYHSLVFQSPVLLRRTASQNIAFVLGQQKLSRAETRKRTKTALNEASLEDCADTPARCLSGGEQQRLALARALVVKPASLLLDEATASLDPASTFIVEDIVKEADLNGIKIVFVTHDIRQAKRLADDILFIHEGRVLAHKPAKAFFKDPGSEQAQAYLDGHRYSKPME